MPMAGANPGQWKRADHTGSEFDVDVVGDRPRLAAEDDAVGEIVGTKVNRKRIADGLRADMASSIVSPFFGSFTQSAFAQNVGLVAITGVKSRSSRAFISS